MRAKEVLNELNTYNGELYKPEIIKGLITVLDVLESDIIDDKFTCYNKEYINNKYHSIIDFLRKSAKMEVKPTYDMIGVVEYQILPVHYAFSLFYNNYIINDILSILDVLENDKICNLLDNPVCDKDDIIIDYYSNKNQIKYIIDNYINPDVNLIIKRYGQPYPLCGYINNIIMKQLSEDDNIFIDKDGDIKVISISDITKRRMQIFGNLLIDLGLNNSWGADANIQTLSDDLAIKLMISYVHVLDKYPMVKDIIDIILEKENKGEI